MEIFTLENMAALATLTALEIVLGIDNIVFIAILTGRLPKEQQPGARRMGLGLAMIMRILLLLGITWVMSLTRPIFTVMEQSFSGRDLILLGGGLFLIVKATHEIHGQFEEAKADDQSPKASLSYASAVAQIGALDIVFSLDSVITAVGMAQALWVMIAAVVLAVVVMVVFSRAVSDFIHRHPTMRMLALSFLILIGVMLVAEGMGRHIERGYVYFAMAFSMGVELLNMRVRGKAESA